jgi:hypothetical protein
VNGVIGNSRFLYTTVSDTDSGHGSTVNTPTAKVKAKGCRKKPCPIPSDSDSDDEQVQQHEKPPCLQIITSDKDDTIDSGSDDCSIYGYTGYCKMVANNCFKTVPSSSAANDVVKTNLTPNKETQSPHNIG